MQTQEYEICVRICKDDLQLLLHGASRGMCNSFGEFSDHELARLRAVIERLSNLWLRGDDDVTGI